MSILLDTDVLSAFAKIDGLDLIHELVLDEEVLITNGVYEELVHIKESGYDFVDQIFNFVRNTPMGDPELSIPFIPGTHQSGQGRTAMHRGLHRAKSPIHHE